MTSSAKHIVIITGMSGSGKSTAIRALEDAGFFCIDNLPVLLLPKLTELAGSGQIGRLALVMDAREGVFLREAPKIIDEVRRAGHQVDVLFLDASDDSLIRRFSETRHRHPLANGRSTQAAIQLERRLLDPIRAEADVVLDTSDLPLRELRERLFVDLTSAETPDTLAIQLISFGYKHGIPLEADLVFDVRFMQNPYYVEELRQLSGLTEAVRAYVLGQPVATAFLEYLEGFLTFAIPAYVSEGKTRLTIGIGCTGGYHRSIVISEALATWLREQGFGPVAVFHRELERS